MSQLFGLHDRQLDYFIMEFYSKLIIEKNIEGRFVNYSYKRENSKFIISLIMSFGFFIKFSPERTRRF